MTTDKIRQILADTAYVRCSGTREEKTCAAYLIDACKSMGVSAAEETFPVDMADVHEATLTADGVSIRCKGYKMAGSATVEGPFVYLPNTDDYSLSLCRGKIVMVDGYMGAWVYRDLLKHGALGIITYDGNVRYEDESIDARELRSYVSLGEKIPCVNIHVKDAIHLVENGVKTAKISLAQTEYTGESRNVVAELPGETDEIVLFSAHYDTTSLSKGAYDNMSGCIGLLGLMEYFTTHPHKHTLRFVFCGSEERGLLGAKAYVASHEGELEIIRLNINLDMIGSTMGKFIACCTADEALVHYIDYMAKEVGFGIHAYADVYSSDSTPFADKGIPAISFARSAPPSVATIHNVYDTQEVLSAKQIAGDIDFICAFAHRMANAAVCPVKREMPDAMKEKLDKYLLRKRK